LTSIYVRVPLSLEPEELKLLHELALRYTTVSSGRKEYHMLIGKRWVAFLKREHRVTRDSEEIDVEEEIEARPIFENSNVDCSNVDARVTQVSEKRFEIIYYCYETFYGGVLLAIIDPSEPYEIEETVLRLLAVSVPEFAHRAVLRPM